MSNNNLPFSDDSASICSSSTIDSSSLTAANMKEKYEKLVQDFVKTKNKLTVVKKAYVELNENMTQKDQNMRKYEQEVESLSFRNQQLSSRVVVLQNELASATSHGKHASGNSSADNTAIDKNVIFEELNNKINENETLHKRISELEDELSKKEQDYQVILSQNKLAKGAQDNLKKENSTEIIIKNSQIEKLQNDKIRLELRLIKLENELKEIKQKQSEVQQTSPQQLLANSPNNIDAKLNGDIKRYYNELYDTTSVIKLVNELLDGLMKVYNCVDDKLNVLNSRDKLLNVKIVEDNLKQIEESISKASFDNFHEFNKQYLSILDANKSVFKEFLNLNRLESDYYSKLAESTHREACLQHNNSISLATEHILNLFESLYFNNTNKKSLNLINKVYDFNRNENIFKSSAESRNEFIDELNEFLNSLNKINKKMNELLSVLNERTSLQHEIGSETSLITNDECFIFYLNDFNLKLNQICRFLVKYIEAVDTKLKYPQLFECNNTKSIDKSEITLKSDSDTYGENHAADIEYIAASETKQKSIEMRDNETQYDCLVEDDSQKTSEKIEKIEENNQQESRCGNDNHRDGDESKYYEEQMDELKYKLFMSESKLACVYQEFHSLGEYLAMQMHKTNETNEVYEKMRNDYRELQDELEVTRQRYEDQLRTMSDHIASMNEQFVRQAESMNEHQHQQQHHQQQNQASRGLVSKLNRKSK